MAIEIFEGFPSRQMIWGERPSIEFCYVLIGTDDEATATAAMDTYASASYGSLVKQEVHGEQTAPDAWDFKVKYGPRKPPQAGDFSFNFDFTGGTQHITQAKQNLRNYAAQGTAPNFQGAIGVDGQGNVAGCDIVVPVYHFTETWQIPAVTVTGAYKLGVYGLVGRTNRAAFRGFSPLEVLFMGASGSISAKNRDVWEITFKFAASPHIENQSIGSIAGIRKGGWEYLWVRYQESVDADAKVLVKRPASVHVERVYGDGDYSVLAIGS